MSFVGTIEVTENLILDSLTHPGLLWPKWMLSASLLIQSND